MPPPSYPPKPKTPTRYVKSDGSTFTLASVHDLVGLGRTAIVLRHGNKVLKIPRLQVTTHLSDEARYYAEYDNEMSIEQIENEKRIYERLGKFIGIVPCSQISADGIELAYMKNGSLDKYLQNHQQGAGVSKADWLRSLVDTLCYIHGRGVLVNDIALRNILVGEDLSLYFVDFDQSSMSLDSDTSALQPHEQSTLSSPLSTITTSDSRHDDLSVQIDIFQLAFAMYSIVVWKKHEYNLYRQTTVRMPSDECLNDGLLPAWPSLTDLPNTDGTLCGDIIHKCWLRAYRSMPEVRDEIYAALNQP